MFNALEIASMSAEDLAEYRNSIINEMERESELEYAKEEGIEKGMEQGKLDVAIRMRKNGFSDGDIMLATGLTEQQIQKL